MAGVQSSTSHNICFVDSSSLESDIGSLSDGSENNLYGMHSLVGGNTPAKAGVQPDRGRVSAAGGAGILDNKDISGKAGGCCDEKLVIMQHKCRSPLCKRCGVGVWGGIRAKIIFHAHLFRSACLLTLTFDPKNFPDGAGSAYDYGREKVRTFLRLFGFKKAFLAVGFHSSGWAHLHLIVDAFDVSGSRRRGLRDHMWALWRDKWGCGRLDYNPNYKNFHQGLAAFNYAISYCQNQVRSCGDHEVSIPLWVSERKHFRSYECFGSLKTAVRGQVDSDDDSEGSGCTRGHIQSIGQRLRACGAGSNVFRVSENGRTWLGTMSLSPGQVRMLAPECEAEYEYTEIRPPDDSDGCVVVDCCGRPEYRELRTGGKGLAWRSGLAAVSFKLSQCVSVDSVVRDLFRSCQSRGVSFRSFGSSKHDFPSLISLSAELGREMSGMRMGQMKSSSECLTEAHGRAVGGCEVPF